ncbi:MAG: tail fiber protein [Flavobacteriaceae bacterium]
MKNFILGLFLVTAFSFSNSVNAQEAMIGEVKMFAGNFAPRGWAFCNGQLLPISQNSALFSILGTTYGGDGRTTFALPDLRGRVAVHAGSGTGLIRKQLGQRGGEETVNITVKNLPSHSHAVKAVAEVGDEGLPNGNLPASNSTANKSYSTLSSNATMSKSMIENTGGNLPVNNMQPYLTVNYIICLEGIFPSRN